MTTRRPPNVLFVFADQMRGMDLHCAGNPDVITPNFDRLAAEGTRFRRAFANVPVCTPSRAVMLTGRYPLANRVIGNDLPLPDDMPTIGEWFRDSGYRTGYIGKWHLDGVPRSRFTPPGSRRHGFEHWAAHNCSHDYFRPEKWYRDDPARYDPEYVRGGVAQLFVVTEPLRGWRHVTVGAQRTRLEFAQCIQELVDVHYPDAERIVLVMDQLNIHNTASLYAAFPPDEARRLAGKLEIHHTPKHGSWLNMAELELSVLARQCLSQRLPDQAAMEAAVTAWADRRNAAIHTIDWQFTTDDARIKLRRLYPAFDA